MPDASAFEPDSGVTDEARDAHWPEQPAKAAMADEHSRGAEDQKRTRASAKEEGKRRRAEDDNDREPRNAEHPRSRRHAKSATDDPGGDVVARIKSFAAVFSGGQQAAH